MESKCAGSLLLSLLLGLLQTNQRSRLVPLGAEEDQDGHFVVGQVVEARLDDHESLPSTFMATRCVFLSTAPTNRDDLVGESVLQVPANDALLVHGKLNDLVDLRLRGLGDHGEHAQARATPRSVSSRRNRRSGRPGRSTARPTRPVDRRSRRCRYRRSRFRRSRSRRLRRCSRNSRRPWPSSPRPRPCPRPPTARPPSARIAPVPAWREAVPAGEVAIDGGPRPAADELAVGESSAAAGATVLPPGPRMAAPPATLV